MVAAAHPTGSIAYNDYKAIHKKRKIRMMATKRSASLKMATAVSVSICLFALLLHMPFAFKSLAWVAFGSAALLISFLLARHQQVLLNKKLWRLPAHQLGITGSTLIISIIVSIWYRISSDMPWWPVSLEFFVLLSVLIGATEEILFRGIVFGEASRWHITGAIWFSALAFAAYKALLFVWPSPINHTNPFTLFSVSFIAGLLLGYVRKKSGSLWPCLLAHGIFDLWVYAETPHAPWWVW